MKFRFLPLLTVVLTGAGFSSGAMAVQVTVKDVSNQIMTCDPKLVHLPESPNACLGYPDGTLIITVTLEATDKPDILDNIHVVVENNGQYFQYNTVSDGTEEGSKRWKKLVVEGLLAEKPFTASFQRFPFETGNSFTRQVDIGEFYSKKGSKLHVGVRANDTAGFVKGSVKEAFEVQ